VLQNLENALPAQQFAGPHGSGGYCAQLSTLMPDAAWRRFSDSGLTAVAGCCAPGNDGCLLLTPGTGCRGEGDSVADGDNPSDDCMTNRRFRSMFALWTVNSFNLLLTGDFAQLNSFVMGTWTNDVSRHDIAATWVAFFSRCQLPSGLHSSQDASDIVADRWRWPSTKTRSGSRRGASTTPAPSAPARSCTALRRRSLPRSLNGWVLGSGGMWRR